MTWDFGVPGEVKVTMKGYVEEVLKVSQVTGTVSTPASEQLFSTRDATLLQPVQKEEFHSIVAKMLYLAKRTRPDLLLPITFLTTRVQAPDEDDWSKLQRVMKYLNGSKELGIVLRPRPSSQIDAYIDASYGVHIDGKSHSGMFISLGAGPVLVKSVKQKIVTKSSTEAELIALSDLCSVVIWTRDFLVAQGEEPPPATIFQDNQSTIALAEKGFSTSDRTKHVKIRYFWVKDRVDSGEIKIVYIPTEDMIADILTKPLQGEKFRQLRMSLLNWVY
jgi:histone deacetylase 1/2